MAINIGINGFGRIGRLILRAIVESKRRDIEVVGSRISAASRGLFRLVGRMLRLN
mgnify:CR=1 FL=1